MKSAPGPTAKPSGTAWAAHIGGTIVHPQLELRRVFGRSCSEHCTNAAELLGYVEHNMPALDPGSLSDEEYRSATAWLLAQNGFEPLFDRSSAGGIALQAKP